MKGKFIFVFVFIFIFFCFELISSLDIIVSFPSEPEVKAGDKIYFEVDVRYPENFERKDLYIIHSVKDMSGKEVLTFQSLRAIQNRISFVDYVFIPSNFETGNYIFEIDVNDGEKNLGQSKLSFFVLNEDEINFKQAFYILFASMIFIAFLVILDIIKSGRAKK